MSTGLASLSDRPFVTSGTAVRPPDPVVVVTPAPSRRNHASIVNVAAPSPGAGPSATYALVPPKSIAWLSGPAGVTVTVMTSLLVSRPSLAVSVSTYEPAEVKVAVVAREPAFPNVTGAGPLAWLHCVVTA